MSDARWGAYRRGNWGGYEGMFVWMEGNESSPHRLGFTIIEAQSNN